MLPWARAARCRSTWCKYAPSIRVLFCPGGGGPCRPRRRISQETYFASLNVLGARSRRCTGLYLIGESFEKELSGPLFRRSLETTIARGQADTRVVGISLSPALRNQRLYRHTFVVVTLVVIVVLSSDRGISGGRRVRHSIVKLGRHERDKCRVAF